ncbi:cupin domain-containing protein [Streptomyces sp. NPDC005820]|uniref:cupin domain-containing protein n=1 Tax=Streptomyces sp. NPDC005820 TaxID=3157069 RepID=UPI0033E566A0
MQSANLHEASYRHGDWGPAYLLHTDSLALGVLRLRPGDSVENHLHWHCDESFVVVEGTATLWLDARESVELGEGEVHSCSPGEMHHLRNDSAQDFRCVFIKTPPSPGDTIPVPWQPGDPYPDVPARP